MEQLVKFISDSISDMTCKGGSFEQTSLLSSTDRQADPPWNETTRMSTERQADPPWNEATDDQLEFNSMTNQDIHFGSFCNAGEMRSSTVDEWLATKQHCNINPPGFGNKFTEVDDIPQDVIAQQSQVSSSKSPSVLASEIIGSLLLEALDGFLFILDKRNDIQFISQNVTQYLKYTKEDLIGKNIFLLVHQDDQQSFNEVLQLVMVDSKIPPSTCRMLIKQTGKSQPAYDKMQISTTLQSYPLESKSNPGNQLVTCVARKVGLPKPNIPFTEIEQFTTKQDVKGVILDTCGLNPENSGFSNLIGQNIQNFCHVNDKPQLFKHHREVLSSGTNTSGVYRFKLKEDKHVFVQTKSQLFKNPENPKLDFVMSTHSIVKECCDDNELKGSASSSLVKAIIGQTGNKQKIRQQPGEDKLIDYPSYYPTMHPQGESMENKLVDYWRGGEPIQRSRGRGERLTTRPVGRPRLHPGGFASSRLHSQMSKYADQDVGRDGHPSSIYSGHHQRRRRRQQHLSKPMGCDSEMYSPHPQNKHLQAATTDNISCYNPKNNFGSQQRSSEMSTSVNNSGFLPASEQSFLDELLAETSELESSFLNEDFCNLEFDDSILEEVTKQSFNYNKSNAMPQFNESLGFESPLNNIRSSVASFKRADFRGTLAEDHTHLADLLMDDKNSLDLSRRDAWSNKFMDKKKDKGCSNNSNVILKKLLSQDDEDKEDEDDNNEGGGRVLALLTQGTAMGQVFQGGICKQLKKELESNASKESTTSNINREESKVFLKPDEKNDFCSGIARRSIDDVNNFDNAACKERQNVLLKELLNEKTNQSTPLVQSKLLKSLLASDEANFDVFEEKCGSENNVGLLPIVERNSDVQFFTGNSQTQQRNFNNSDIVTNGNNNDLDDNFLSSNFSLDFDCMTNCDQNSNEDDACRKMNATFAPSNSDDLSKSALLGCNANGLLVSEEGNTTDVCQEEAFLSPPSVDKKFFSTSTPDCSTSDSLIFSYDRPDRNNSVELRPSRKNILLAQLLSRTTDDVSSASSSAIFPTRNASIAVVTPMVHLLEQNKNCSTPYEAVTCSQKLEEEEVCGSHENVDVVSKKVKLDDQIVRNQAKPSASLQPFRCHPSNARHVYSSSPIPAFSTSSSSLFLSLSSPASTSMEIFTPKTQLHYSGGTMEHVNDRFSQDGSLIGVVPRFDSSAIGVKQYDVLEEVSLKNPHLTAVQLKTLESNVTNKKQLIDFQKCGDETTGECRNIRPSSACSIHLCGDGVHSNEMFSSIGRITSGTDALPQISNQSSNVCSTKPFITQPSLLTVPPTSEEDPFSTTYSPISPALQDESSQQETPLFSNVNFQPDPNNIYNNVIGDSSKNLTDVSVGMPQTPADRLASSEDFIKKETSGFNLSQPMRGVQMHLNFNPTLNDWKDGLNIGNRMFKHDLVLADDVSIVNNSSITRKRLRSEVFSEPRWNVNRANPSSFDSLNQHQAMFLNQQMLGDSKRHPGIYPSYQRNVRFPSQGQELAYGKMQSDQRAHFNAMQDVIPTYQMERCWDRPKWTRPMVGMKPSYGPSDYSSLAQDRPCYVGPQISEKIIGNSQYFHPQIHQIQQSNLQFNNHLRPTQSFPPQYFKHNGDYMTCCNSSNCPSDPHNRHKSYDNNCQTYMKSHQQQHRNMIHHQQQLQLAQAQHHRHSMMQQRMEDSEGRKLCHHDDGSSRPLVHHKSSPFTHQKSSSCPAAQQSTSVNHPSPADPLPHTPDDSLRIHPDSGLFDFTIDEVSCLGANQMFQNFGEDLMKGQQIEQQGFNNMSYGGQQQFNDNMWAVESMQPHDNLQPNSLKNSITINNNNSRTKEFLRKELRNICTARSQQQNKASDNNNNSFLHEASLQLNVEDRGKKFNETTTIESQTKSFQTSVINRALNQGTNASDVTAHEGGEAEDIFRSFSFTDVENDMFWTSVADDNKVMTFNCDDLF